MISQSVQFGLFNRNLCLQIFFLFPVLRVDQYSIEVFVLVHHFLMLHMELLNLVISLLKPMMIIHFHLRLFVEGKTLLDCFNHQRQILIGFLVLRANIVPTKIN